MMWMLHPQIWTQQAQDALKSELPPLMLQDTLQQREFQFLTGIRPHGHLFSKRQRLRHLFDERINANGKDWIGQAHGRVSFLGLRLSLYRSMSAQRMMAERDTPMLTASASIFLTIESGILLPMTISLSSRLHCMLWNVALSTTIVNNKTQLFYCCAKLSKQLQF